MGEVHEDHPGRLGRLKPTPSFCLNVHLFRIITHTRTMHLAPCLHNHNQLEPVCSMYMPAGVWDQATRAKLLEGSRSKLRWCVLTSRCFLHFGHVRVRSQIPRSRAPRSKVLVSFWEDS